MKTLIYIRTSTEEQNPENQLKDCLSLNESEDYEVIEEKVSGWAEKERIGFNRATKLIKSNKVDHFIVWDLDRIYRNRLKLIGFFELCKIYNVQIHSYRQGWLESLNKIQPPFNDIMHSLMLQMMGWLAEEESTKKSERVKAAVRTKGNVTYSRKGNKWGRKSLSTQKINKIIELRNSGLSIRNISNVTGISIGSVHKTLANSSKEITQKEGVH